MDDWKNKVEEGGQVAEAVKQMPEPMKRELGRFMSCLVLAAKFYGIATDAKPAPAGPCSA